MPASIRFIRSILQIQFRLENKRMKVGHRLCDSRQDVQCDGDKTIQAGHLIIDLPITSLNDFVFGITIFTDDLKGE